MESESDNSAPKGLSSAAKMSTFKPSAVSAPASRNFSLPSATSSTFTGFALEGTPIVSASTTTSTTSASATSFRLYMGGSKASNTTASTMFSKTGIMAIASKPDGSLTRSIPFSLPTSTTGKMSAFGVSAASASAESTARFSTSRSKMTLSSSGFSLSSARSSVTAGSSSTTGFSLGGVTTSKLSAATDFVLPAGTSTSAIKTDLTRCVQTGDQVKSQLKPLVRKRSLKSVSGFTSEKQNKVNRKNIVSFSNTNPIGESSVKLKDSTSHHHLQLNKEGNNSNVSKFDNPPVCENVIEFVSEIKEDVYPPVGENVLDFVSEIKEDVYPPVGENILDFVSKIKEDVYPPVGENVLDFVSEINAEVRVKEDFNFIGENNRNDKKRRSLGYHVRRFKNTGTQSKQINSPKISNVNDNFNEDDLVMLEDCSNPQLDHFDLNDDVIIDFEDFVSIETEDNLQEYVNQKSQYQIRKERVTSEFLQKTSLFSKSFIESQFKSDIKCVTESCAGDKVASTFCETCGYLCHECDILQHSKNLHARYYHGKRIKSGLASDGSLFENILDLGISKECDVCKSQLFLKKEPGILKVVKLNGIFTAHHSVYTCSDCNINKSYTIEDFWSNRLFPVNCDPKANFLCTFDVFEQWQTLKNASPMTALSSYIQCLNKDRLISVDQMQFDSAYQQYQKIKLTIEQEMYGINHFECAAKLSPHAIHVDGDLKCKHLNLNQNECNENHTYYGSSFFVPDSEVNTVTDYCAKNKLCSKKPGDVNCGTAKWTAAGNAMKKSSPVDIKGLQLASCTHLVNVAACNLPRGELFANNLLLQRKVQDVYDVETCGSDVACKYSTWYNDKVCGNPQICEDLSLKSKEVDICLGELHSKGHALDCRIANSINWKNKGRLQGLEMQEMNNNPFSRGRFRTAFMTKNRRMDEFSEMAYLINKKRNEEMVSMLLKRRKRIEKEIFAAQKVLATAEREESITITDEKIDAIKKSALEVRKKSKTDFQTVIEFHSLSVAVKKLKLLSTFDPGERQKLVQNLRSHSEKLKDQVNSNNVDPSKEKLDLENCLNGIFPWSKSFLPQEAHANPLRFIDLCEVYLKIKNSDKELDIIERDIKSILEQRLIVINNLSLRKEMFSKLVNQARAEKQLELISDLLDELQMINESKKMNIDTNWYFEKLNLDPYSTNEKQNRGGSKEKLILESEQQIQDLMLTVDNLAEVLDDIL